MERLRELVEKGRALGSTVSDSFNYRHASGSLAVFVASPESVEAVARVINPNVFHSVRDGLSYWQSEAGRDQIDCVDGACGMAEAILTLLAQKALGDGS